MLILFIIIIPLDKLNYIKFELLINPYINFNEKKDKLFYILFRLFVESISQNIKYELSVKERLSTIISF